jgi:hypothetical protein
MIPCKYACHIFKVIASLFRLYTLTKDSATAPDLLLFLPYKVICWQSLLVLLKVKSIAVSSVWRYGSYLVIYCLSRCWNDYGFALLPLILKRYWGTELRVAILTLPKANSDQEGAKHHSCFSNNELFSNCCFCCSLWWECKWGLYLKVKSSKLFRVLMSD